MASPGVYYNENHEKKMAYISDDFGISVFFFFSEPRSLSFRYTIRTKSATSAIVAQASDSSSSSNAGSCEASKRERHCDDTRIASVKLFSCGRFH